jgi:hypothetical protein
MLLPLFIAPLVLRIGKMPSPFSSLMITKVPAVTTTTIIHAADKDKVVVLDGIGEDHSYDGGMLVFTLTYGLFTLLHPNTTCSNYAVFYALLVIYQDLFFPVSSIVVQGKRTSLDQVNQLKTNDEQKEYETKRDCDGKGNECKEGKGKQEEKGVKEVKVIPRRSNSVLFGVVLVGTMVTFFGILTTWKLWVVGGRGNANYLYFQSLAFHSFQVEGSDV